MTNETIFKTDDPQLALLFAQVQAEYFAQGDLIVPSEEDKKSKAGESKPKAEKSKAEESKPKAEKPKAEEPEAEKPKAEESKPKAEESKAEESKPKAEESKAEKPKKATKKGSKLKAKKAEIPYKVGDKVEFLIDGDWDAPSVITEINNNGDVYVFTIVTEEDGEEFTVVIDREFSEVRLIEKK